MPATANHGRSRFHYVLQVTNFSKLKMILDIPLKVSVELGRTKMLVNDLLQLGQGSVIELDKIAGEPMEILINDKLVAMGEVVVQRRERDVTGREGRDVRLVGRRRGRGLVGRPPIGPAAGIDASLERLSVAGGAHRHHAQRRQFVRRQAGHD